MLTAMSIHGKMIDYGGRIANKPTSVFAVDWTSIGDSDLNGMEHPSRAILAPRATQGMSHSKPSSRIDSLNGQRTKPNRITSTSLASLTYTPTPSKSYIHTHILAHQSLPALKIWRNWPWGWLKLSVSPVGSSIQFLQHARVPYRL